MLPVNQFCIRNWSSSRFVEVKQAAKKTVVEKDAGKKWLKDKKSQSAQPSDLKSFQETAAEKNTDSYHYTGTEYEYKAIEALKNMSFDIQRCGKAGDQGVDFRGIWTLPDKSIPVIGQCKKEAKKCPPKYIRELEGTITHQSQSIAEGTHQNLIKDLFGIFVSHSGYSTEAITYAMQSQYPIILSLVDSDLQITQFKLNTKANKLLPNLLLGHKFVMNGNSERVKVISLFYDGNALEAK